MLLPMQWLSACNKQHLFASYTQINGYHIFTQINKLLFKEKNTCVVFAWRPWRIGRAKKAHNIGKELVKPAALDMVRTIYKNEFAKKLENVPLSNDTGHKPI